jgi:hypothetical protein
MKITKKLIDRALELQALIAPLAAEFDAIKEAVKAEGDGLYVGRLAEIEVTTAETCTLDTKKVKALLTPAQITACSREGSRTTLKVRERQVALKVAA